MRLWLASPSTSRWLLALAGSWGALVASPAQAASIAADKLAEPALTATGAQGTYLRQIHQRVHSRWTDNFLRLASEKLPAEDPVNQSTRAATVDVVLGGDGEIVSIDVSQSAGVAGFDDAVKEILRDSVPFPFAPVEVSSDDERVHLRWTFARDERRCSSIEVIHAEEPMPIAFPKLLRDHREDEVLRRLGVARNAGAAVEPMMTTAASAWVKAVGIRPDTTVEVADLLATQGDGAGVKWLKEAVKRPELAAAAGRSLAAHHVPICPIVGPVFGPAFGAASGAAGGKAGSPAEQQSAAVALATAGEAACAPGLITLLENQKARPEARASAAIALGTVTTDEAKKALAAASKDNVVAVRAAALLAGARPGSGRGKVLSLVTPLRDPAPEVRAAAAAGIVRAGGDANLADLYVVFKDSDPRPAAAVAVELDGLRTEESTKLLVRLLKRPHLTVQLAAARALIRRGARESFPALRPFLDAKTDADLRGLALVAAESSTLDNLAKTIAATPTSSDGKADVKTAKLALATYRAQLSRGERTPAADLLIAVGGRLTAAERANLMVAWLASGSTANASATAASTTAAVTPAH